MKLVKTASGKTRIKMSRKEWTDMGKKAGWLKQASEGEFWNLLNGILQFGGEPPERLLNSFFPNGQPDTGMLQEIMDTCTALSDQRFHGLIINPQKNVKFLYNNTALPRLKGMCQQAMTDPSQGQAFVNLLANTIEIMDGWGY